MNSFDLSRAMLDERKQPAEDPASYTVTFLGDIGFGEHYMYHPRASGLQRMLSSAGYEETMVHVLPLLEKADFKLGNLEVPLSDRPDARLKMCKNYLSWSDPDLTVDALRHAGISAVSLGNNHSIDCGRDGLLNTVRLLETAGIAAIGAGIDRVAAQRPLIHRFKQGGRERSLVVFAAYAYVERYAKRYRWYAMDGLPGVNPIDDRQIARTIDALRQDLPNPFFVVFPHWGEVYEPVNEAQKTAAAALIDAGVDLIVGHGTHAGQIVEMVAGKPVLYGIGNFIWNTPGSYSKYGCPQYSLIASLIFDRPGGDRGYTVRLHPIVTDNMVTKFQARPTDPGEFVEAAGLFSSTLHVPLIRGTSRGAPFIDFHVPG